MRKATFDYMCAKLRVHIERKILVFTKKFLYNFALPSLCGMFIQKLSIGLWGVSPFVWTIKTICCCIIHDVCKAIVKVLMKCYIKFPVGEELKVVNGFNEKWRYQNCGGVIN